MNASRLLEYYGRVVEAPNAIALLKRLVLDLAVRGKLVPQDANDEPAATLLETFSQQKARLLADRTIRRIRSLPMVNLDNLDPVPGWIWVRLGTVSSLITKGSTPTSYGHEYTSAGVSFIKVESIKQGLLLPCNVRSYISEATHDFLSRSQLQCGDILFSIAGSIGTCALVTNAVLPANTNQAIAIIRGTQAVFSPSFLLITMRSSAAHATLTRARGGAMNNISLEDVENFIVPVPPLAEQQRIVAKVDELMTLCDEIKATRTKREAARDRVFSATIARMNAPDSEPTVFAEHARSAVTLLNILTARPDQINQLREAILTLAVRGKLTLQDSKEESASILLERIHEWRRQSVSRGDIRMPRKPLEPVRDDAPTWQLPAGWTWARLGELIYIQSGDALTAENMRGGNFPVFGGNGINGYHNESNVGESTVVIGRVGYYCGSVHVTPSKAWVTDNAFITHFCVSEIYLDFLALLLRITNLKENEKATAQPVISGSKIYPIVVGLPPLPEQRRIVETFDRLSVLCDQLEATLVTGDELRSRLLDAILAETLTAA